MKHAALFTVLTVSFGIALTAVACSSGSTTSPRLGASAGVGAGGDTNGVGNGNGNGVTTQQGVGGSTSTGFGGNMTTASGGSCKMGGVACVAFNECCSGTCQNQICTNCSGNGESCDVATCCNGLTCNANTCGTCKGDGDTCINATDCCSNTCENGSCAACGSSTCLMTLETMGDPSALCGPAKTAYDNLKSCACGTCAEACSPFCSGQPLDATCEQCVSMSCMTQLQACEMN